MQNRIGLFFLCLAIFSILSISVQAQTCYSKLDDIPASCEGGNISEDNKAGCRTIICNDGGNFLRVLACEKPDTGTKEFFEMYKQSFAGNVPKICIGSTCLKDEGYVKSANYPICTGEVIQEYKEDFNDGIAQGWDLIPGFEQPASYTIQVVNGIYKANVSSGNLGIAFFGNLQMPDTYTASIKIKLAERIPSGTSDQGLMFVNLKEYPTGASNQQFLLSGWRQSQSNDFFLTGEGTTYNLGHITAPFEFDESQWHTITIVKVGNNFRLFINSNLGLNVTLPAAINGGTIGLQLSQGIFEIDDVAVSKDVIIPQQQGQTCFNTVNELPANCTGTITQDIKSGCRTLECSSGSNSVKVQACPKTDSQGKFFEIYRQAFTGTQPQLCLGNDCLKSGWGYERGDYFPVCISSAPACTPSTETCDSKDNDCDGQVDEGNVCGTTPVCGNGVEETGEQCDDGNTANGDGCSSTCQAEQSTTCFNSVKTIPANCTSTIISDTSSGTCRTIQCGSGANTIKVFACDKPDIGTKQYFEMYKQSATGAPPKVCIGPTCIQNEGYKKSGSYPICTTTQTATNQTEPSPVAELNLVDGFPHDHNAAFQCNVSGFSAVNYTFNFGDGTSETRPVFDVYHTYFQNGTYNVTCTATDGTKSASDSLSVEIVAGPISREQPDRIFMVDVLTVEKNGLLGTFRCEDYGFASGLFFWDINDTNFPRESQYGEMAPGGKEFNWTFSVPGTYEVKCRTHLTDETQHPNFYDYTTFYHDWACKGAQYGDCFSIPKSATVTFS